MNHIKFSEINKTMSILQYDGIPLRRVEKMIKRELNKKRMNWKQLKYSIELLKHFYGSITIQYITKFIKSKKRHKYFMTHYKKYLKFITVKNKTLGTLKQKITIHNENKHETVIIQKTISSISRTRNYIQLHHLV